MHAGELAEGSHLVRTKEETIMRESRESDREAAAARLPAVRAPVNAKTRKGKRPPQTPSILSAPQPGGKEPRSSSSPASSSAAMPSSPTPPANRQGASPVDRKKTQGGH